MGFFTVILHYAVTTCVQTFFYYIFELNNVKLNNLKQNCRLYILYFTKYIMEHLKKSHPRVLQVLKILG